MAPCLATSEPASNCHRTERAPCFQPASSSYSTSIGAGVGVREVSSFCNWYRPFHSEMYGPWTPHMHRVNSDRKVVRWLDQTVGNHIYERQRFRKEPAHGFVLYIFLLKIYNLWLWERESSGIQVNSTESIYILFSSLYSPSPCWES